jgi:molybdate transport system regulatory protein
MTSSLPPLRPVLRIDFPPTERLGRGKMELLEHIQATGSISAAGRAMDMSYRRAWLLVDGLNHMFDTTVVESKRGGKQGGGAVVTEFGTELLHRYRTMERKAAAALEADLAWIDRHRNKSGPADA